MIPTWEQGPLLPRSIRGRVAVVDVGETKYNDYPHHEGAWPHSAEAIERTMGHLSDAARAKVLGLNAARLFGFEVRG